MLTCSQPLPAIRRSATTAGSNRRPPIPRPRRSARTPIPALTREPPPCCIPWRVTSRFSTTISTSHWPQQSRSHRRPQPSRTIASVKQSRLSGRCLCRRLDHPDRRRLASAAPRRQSWACRHGGRSSWRQLNDPETSWADRRPQPRYLSSSWLDGADMCARVRRASRGFTARLLLLGRSGTLEEDAPTVGIGPAPRDAGPSSL